MPTTISCPSCQRTLNVPDELLGKTVKCPTCFQTFLAAAETGEPPSRQRATPPRRRADYDDEPPEDDYDDDRPRPRRRRRDSNLQPHRGTLILVLGIVGLVAFTPLGIAAWIMGNNDLQAMRAGRMDPEGESNTNAGRICGMIATILLIISLVIGCVFVIFWLAYMRAFVGGR